MNVRLSNLILKTAILPALMVLGGCASDRGLLTLSPVGPGSSGAVPSDGPGHLLVYNATHETPNRDGAMTYPHDDYKICNERMVCIKRVRNRVGAEGETPDRVDLPPGSYTVVTESERQGAIAVPVIIKSSLTTEVNLEQARRIITPVFTAYK